jgi:protein-tyrosine phosphatase
MIDLHCHILHGVDDGPATIDQAAELIRASLATGVTALVATPHVSPRYRNDSHTIADRAAEVTARLAADGVSIDLHNGAEIAIPRLADLAGGELDRLTLGGGSWLLIESPFKTPVDELPVLLGRVRESGHRIILAHPERCPGFHTRPDVLFELVGEGEMLVSVTAGSLIGQFGREVQRFTFWMARNGLVHNVASDAHDCVRRPPGIAHAIEQAGLGAHIELLTHGVPNAILTDGPLPDLPSALLPDRSRPS